MDCSVPPRAVVLDIGGVLLDWDPRHLYRKLIPDPDELEWFLANVCDPEWHDGHDRGGDIAESCAALAQQWPAKAELIWAWYRRGEEMVAGALPDGVDMLRRIVDSRIPCFALTNMEAETYPKRRHRFEFLDWFDGTVVSGFEGIAKPDREIYQLLLSRFGLDPATTLFFDDRQRNVAVAAEVGMDAHLYTGSAPSLHRLGLVAT